jgi:hypothetical protein
MPAVSKAQNRLMQAVAHNPKLAKSTGVKVSVAKDFVNSTTKKTMKGKPERKVKK